MEFPKFAIHLKNLRAFRNKTVYEVAEAVGVSHTYISQMENGKKLPSLKVLFPLVLYLGSRNDKGFMGKMENLEYDGTRLLLEYASYKHLDGKDLLIQYMEYHRDIIMGEMNDISESFEAKKENKVQLALKGGKIKVLEQPYLDLKWLLEQEDFFVFYGRDYDLQNVQREKGSISRSDMYNVLPESDLKIIHDIIEAYLSNKYPKAKLDKIQDLHV